MKQLKKILSLVVIITILLNLSMSAFAIENNENEIDHLFGELTETIALSLLPSTQRTAIEYESKIEDIEEQLSILGVRKLSKDELNNFFREKNINQELPVGLIEETNTVKWYLNEYTGLKYNNEMYDVQQLIAVGNNAGGLLVTGEDNYCFFNDRPQSVDVIPYFFTLYAQKAIGQIPVIGWTPYELLYSYSPKNSFDSSYVTYRCVSTISFSYAKKSSQSDNYYRLSYFRNFLEIAVHAHGAATVDSHPYRYSRQTTETIRPDDNGAIITAIDAYNRNTEAYSYVSSFTIGSYDNKYSKTVSVPNPMVGPGQIY